jgi:hemoglobin
MTTPTLYDWVGGAEALHRLTNEFYIRVKNDELLSAIFLQMNEQHPAHVADFIGEVFGGPKVYSEKHGGHPAMIRHHLNKHLTEPQRRRWMMLLQDSYADLGLPHDPEFASALLAYLEWGTRLAVMNSQSGAEVEEDEPMPKWGWGEPKGPYIAKV